ncbi:restriction endonuclease subunit S [Streptomyces canus]|uniref:restriction endonuclease subunit S n=1 Tax=Streptomyces canus TaxID=58343 RepID=UPI002E36AFF0|nr:restriction endonuclease subunit S [Streptomyces canus]
MTSGRFVESEAKALPRDVSPRPAYEVKPGDVLMSRANGVRALVGVACMVKAVRSMLLLPDLVFRLSVDPASLAPEFLGVILASSSVRRQIDDSMRGSSGQYKISQADVRDLRIPRLKLDEQHRIVAAQAVFERRIGALQRMLGKLRVAEEALSAEALSPQPGWEYAMVEKIADVAAGVTLGAEPFGDGTVELPYLRVANVLDGRIDTADVKRVRIVGSQLERFALRKGDLLLTEGGDLDKLGRGAVWDGRIEPCLHQNHVFRVRCGSKMDPDFLALYTASPEGRAYFQRVGKQTTNLASINSTQVKAMPVPLAPLDAQRRNLEPVRAVRVRVRSVERQIAKLRTIQQGVVEDLLAGRARLPAA